MQLGPTAGAAVGELIVSEEMSVRYAASYVDAIFARRDLAALHTVISVKAGSRTLPRECVLFVRVYEWIGADWQYYESLKPEAYQEMCALLSEFSMTDVLAKFKEAMAAWQSGDYSIAHVDEWANQRRDEIENHILERAEHTADFLKENEEG